MLTFDSSDHTVAIFDQLFEELAGPLQLHFIALESLSELRTVQIAVAELQRRMPHLLDSWLSHNRNTELVLVSHAASCTFVYRTLPHTAHSCSVEATPHSRLSKWSRNHGVRESLLPLVKYEVH